MKIADRNLFRPSAGRAAGLKADRLAGLWAKKSVKVSKQVVFQKVGDGMVLLHMRTGAYYGLNPTGARLWELLKEKKSLRGALDALMTDYYDVKPDVLRRDAMRLVRRLQAKGLIEVVAT